MADSHRARASPYGASMKPGAQPPRKVKAAPSSSNNQSHAAAAGTSKVPRPNPPPSSVPVQTTATGTILPKIECRGGEPAATTSNNNNNSSSNGNLEIVNGSSLAMAISPQARETPASFPPPPRRPSSGSNRVANSIESETSPTIRSDIGEGGGFLGGPSAKAAWRTPRSPMGSHLEPFFVASRQVQELEERVALGASGDAESDTANSVKSMPVRLKSVKENLRAADELYRIDLDKLIADNDKFFEVSGTASQHIEGIQEELPQLSDGFEQTTSALAGLAKDIATLYAQQESVKDKMSQQLDQVFNQGTNEKLALVEAHEAEKLELQYAHAHAHEALKTQFRSHVEELEHKYNTMEKTCLDELQQLQTSSAAQLAQAQQEAAIELANLRESTQSEREALELSWKSEVGALKEASQAELDMAKSSSRAEYEELQAKSQKEYAALEFKSRSEYEEIQSSSAEEIRQLREASASQFADATEKLTRELQELQASKEYELDKLRTQFVEEKTQLVSDAEQEIARLHMVQQEQFTRMNDQRILETTALQSEIEATNSRSTTETQQLVERHTSECEAMKSAMSQTVSSLKSSHAQQIEDLESKAKSELFETMDSYESQLASAIESHKSEVSSLKDEATSTQKGLVDKYESELTLLKEEGKRERDRVALTYETEIDSLKRTSQERLDTTVKALELSTAQLREVHAVKTLQLEAVIRDQEKRFVDTVQAKDAELKACQNQIQVLQSQLAVLNAKHASFVDQSKQLVARKEMDDCEKEARMFAVQEELCSTLTALEATKRELRTAIEDRQVKANTILELTFVIKSRDDEAERLRNALLDSVKNVNQKTEILELTAETLSSKAKELEDTKAALRKESGKLSQVEESMHHKEEIIEDTEMKIERMRLGMENMRLEMKRLQMDMKLQLEHTEGEMELKNGEISRLRASQSELKQKNDFYQQTTTRLEETLALSQHQVDEAQRRIHLLKLEATQNADDARKTCEQVLEKEQLLLVAAKEKQLAVDERQRVQTQLNNVTQVVVPSLHEKQEHHLMYCEELQTRFLRVLAETSAEKDERMRAEKHLLFLELGATKELVRHFEGVELRLSDSKKEIEAQKSQLQSLENRVQELNASTALYQEMETQFERAKHEIEELKTTINKYEHALACTHDKLQLESEASRAGAAALSVTLEELKMEKQHLTSELEALKSDFESQSARNATLEGDIAALRKQKDELTSALSGEKLEMADSIKRIASELGGAKQQFTEQLSNAAGKLQARKDALESLQSKYSLKTQEALELQTQMNGLEAQLSSSVAETQVLSSRCSKLESEVRNLEQALKDETANHLKDLKDSEHELLTKNQEIVSLGLEYQKKLDAREQEVATALQAFEEQKSALCAEYESQLCEVRASFTSQMEAQTDRLAGVEDEPKRMTEDYFVKMNEAENVRVKLIEQRDAALSALQTAHSEEIERLKQEHATAIAVFEEQLDVVESNMNEREKAHLEQLERAQEAHKIELDARLRDLEASKTMLAQDLEKQVETLAETTQREAELSRLRLAEEHLKNLQSIVESANLRDEQQLGALSEAQVRLTTKGQQLEDARQRITICEDQIAQLQRKCEQTEQELDESAQLVVVRTATIDNIRKELNLLHEAANSSLSPQSSDQLLAFFRQQIDTHLWEVYQMDRAQIAGFQLDSEEDFVECLKGFFKMRCAVMLPRAKTRGERAKKSSVGGGSGVGVDLVLSVSAVCGRLEEFAAIAVKHSELFGEQRQRADDEREGYDLKLSSQIISIFNEHKKLVNHVQETFCGPLQRASQSFGGQDVGFTEFPALETLIQSLETHAELLESLGLLKSETQSARCQQLLDISSNHEKLMQRATKSSERLQLSKIQDFNPLLDLISEILALARHATGQTERFQALADLKSLISEFEVLSTGFKAAVSVYHLSNPNTEPSEANSQPALSSKSAGILDFVHKSARFITDCRQTLGLSALDNSSGDGPPGFDANTGEILASLQDLMRVLHHFDSFLSSSSTASSSSSVSASSVEGFDLQPGSSSRFSQSTTPSLPSGLDASIQQKVSTVLTFLDELHLMTDFAQNILDEECEGDDAAATESTGSQSNTSSKESLSLFRSLTRASTPTTSLRLKSGETDSEDDKLQIEVPFPLDELELELQQQQQQQSDLIDPDGDADGGEGGNPGFFDFGDPLTDSASPLAESLMDISLVMNDYHRIISEATYWVHKTAKLRQRRKSSRIRNGDGVSNSPQADLGSEICRLVREHCALLSLAKTLFKLKDPRQDLSSLLECLAILKRLTTRLPVFQNEIDRTTNNVSNSDSSTSLDSNISGSASMAGASNAAFQDSLQSSLSVFACIEDIARHLQDYDFFLQQMRTNSDKRWVSRGIMRDGGAPNNIEVLTKDLNDRLELVAQTQEAPLMLQNPMVELPKFLHRVQELVVSTERLGPWKTARVSEEESEDTNNDLAGGNTDDAEAIKSRPFIPTTTTTIASTEGVKALTVGFERIESDLTTYATFMQWLHGVLPFSRSVESVDNLRERVQEVLSQLERFANENIAMKDEIGGLRAGREGVLQQQALEDAFLADHGIIGAAGDSSSEAFAPRFEVLKQLLEEQRRLTTKTGEVEASAFLETNFLVQSGLWKASASAEQQLGLSAQLRIEIYKKLMAKVRQSEEATCNAETLLVEYPQPNSDILNSKERALRDLESALDQTSRDEKAFLRSHESTLGDSHLGDDCDNEEPRVLERIPIYEQLMSGILRFQAEKRVWDEENADEHLLLQELGLLGPDKGKISVATFVTASDRGNDTGDVSEGNDDTDGGAGDVESEDNVVAAGVPSKSTAQPISHAKRLELYKRLADLQKLVQTEKAVLQQEKSFLESNRLYFDDQEPASSRLNVYKTLLDGQNALIEEKMEREVELEKERAFLESHNVQFDSYMGVFERFAKLRDQIEERNEADAMERAFLLENQLWSPGAFEEQGKSDDRSGELDAQEQFGVRFQVFSELLEAKALEQQAKKQRDAAIEAEKAYLLANTSLEAQDLGIGGPEYSRLHIYEAILAAQRDAEARREVAQTQQLDQFPGHEEVFLRLNGFNSLLEANKSEPASAIRTRVYEELLSRVRQRDETISSLEKQQEMHATSLMAWNEVPMVNADDLARVESEKLKLRATLDDRDALIGCLKEQFTRDQAVEAEKHASEMTAEVQSHANTVKQLEQTHEAKLAGVLASSKQEMAAALEKQAKQLEFLVFVRLGEENLLAGSLSSSSSSPSRSRVSSALSPAQARALLLDKVTKRDSSAISMIYRSIRLATDILNTSAFTPGTSTTNSSEIPVEITQAVLNCVKELKALKEYLIESLEQLTRGDDVFPFHPPPFVKVNVAAVVASGDKEAAIDFALCSHREFMAFAHLELLERQQQMDTRLLKLLSTLKCVAGGSGDGESRDDTNAGVFTVSEAKFMELEIELAREKEACENADCKLKLNDEYYQRLVNERKDVEATLTKALTDLRDECRGLRMKVDGLEQERYAAPPGSFSGSMFGLSPSPRATPTTSSGGSGSIGFSYGGMVMPIRPEKPREPPPSSYKAKGAGGGVGSVHKERFVSDLEKETGQRRSTNTARHLNEWKKQDAVAMMGFSSQLEKEFRAMEVAAANAGTSNPGASMPPMNPYSSYEPSTTTAGGKTSPAYLKGGRGLESSSGAGGGGARAPLGQDQELWYQGVRMVHHISFFVSLFYVPKQHMFRVEVFNSDTEQQQTVYVTWSELQAFLDESKKALKMGVTSLDDPSRRAEITDVLFERVRIYGEGSSNVLLGFE